MPKKTKKQKMLADRRHDQQPLDMPPVLSFQFQPGQTQKQTQTPTKTPEDVSELAAVRADLIKTIILAVLAVGIELSVYWRFFRT